MTGCITGLQVYKKTQKVVGLMFPAQLGQLINVYSISMWTHWEIRAVNSSYLYYQSTFSCISSNWLISKSVYEKIGQGQISVFGFRAAGGCKGKDIQIYDHIKAKKGNKIFKQQEAKIIKNFFRVKFWVDAMNHTTLVTL